MAVDQGKSAFIRDLLGRDPEADEDAVNEAWRKAGNQGSISGSLIYKIRSGLGLTGKGRSADVAAGRPKAKETKAPKAKPVAPARPQSNGPPAASATGSESTAGARGGALDRVEDRIDDLIFELKDLGGMERAQEALRLARRLVVRSHEE
jgi:hypothetical protein